MAAIRQSSILSPSGKPFQVRERQSPRRGDILARHDVLDQTSDSEPYWGLTDSLSPRAAANPYVRAKLRQRARVIIENNCYAAAILRAKANYVVGPGARCQVRTDDRNYNQAVERLFHGWAEYVGFWDSLRLQRFLMAGEGESFGLFKENRGVTFRHPVKLDYELAEPEIFSNPEYEHLNAINEEDGVVLDDYGNVIAYRKYDHHPGDAYPVHRIEGESVSADHVVHLYAVTRAGQLRGVPEITPALMLYPIMRRWTMATLNAAETAARVSGVIKSDAEPDDDDDDSLFEPYKHIDLPVNAWLTLPEKADISQMKAEHPQTTYPMLKQEVTAECARCVDMPYNVAAGDSGKLNFASGKLDFLPFMRSNSCDQGVFARKACGKAFQHWFLFAREIPGYLPPAPASMGGPIPPTAWMWPGNEAIDPREAGATLTDLRSGKANLGRVHSKMGQDAEQEIEEGARILGISVEEYQEHLVRSIFGEKKELTPSGNVSEKGTQETDQPAEAAA